LELAFAFGLGSRQPLLLVSSGFPASAVLLTAGPVADGVCFSDPHSSASHRGVEVNGVTRFGRLECRGWALAHGISLLGLVLRGNVALSISNTPLNRGPMFRQIIPTRPKRCNQLSSSRTCRHDHCDPATSGCNSTCNCDEGKEKTGGIKQLCQTHLHRPRSRKPPCGTGRSRNRNHIRVASDKMLI